MELRNCERLLDHKKPSWPLSGATELAAVDLLGNVQMVRFVGSATVRKSKLEK